MRFLDPPFGVSPIVVQDGVLGHPVVRLWTVNVVLNRLLGEAGLLDVCEVQILRLVLARSLVYLPPAQEHLVSWVPVSLV